MRILAIPLCALLAACASQPPPIAAPPAVGVVTPVPADAIAPTISYVGTLAGEIEVDLAFKLGGRIELIGPGTDRDWRDGDEVAADRVLARLDTAEISETVRACQARATNDAALYERGSRLMDERLISQKELDALTAARDASAADLRKAQAALAEATISAPTAATILRRNVRRGETIAAGAPVLRIADLGRMTVELGVPERIVTRLRPGTPLALTCSAWPGIPIRGTVSEVAASATAATRLFRVRIAVANPDRRLRPGMSATVAIPGDPVPPGAMTVPLSALLAAPDGRAFRVFIVGDDGLARAREVVVADVLGSAAVVTAGLAAGDRVVAAGAGLCAEGMRVEARAHDADALYRRR